MTVLKCFPKVNCYLALISFVFVMCSLANSFLMTLHSSGFFALNSISTIWTLLLSSGLFYNIAWIFVVVVYFCAIVWQFFPGLNVTLKFLLFIRFFTSCSQFFDRILKIETTLKTSHRWYLVSLLFPWCFSMNSLASYSWKKAPTSRSRWKWGSGSTVLGRPLSLIQPANLLEGHLVGKEKKQGKQWRARYLFVPKTSLWCRSCYEQN